MVALRWFETILKRNRKSGARVYDLIAPSRYSFEALIGINIFIHRFNPLLEYPLHN